MVQPDHFTMVSARCLTCKTVKSTPLPGAQLKKVPGEFYLRQAERERFLAELNNKNLPEEEILCKNFQGALVSASQGHARRLQFVRGNLENVLKYSFGVNDNLDVRWDRLDRALLSVPEEIWTKFLNENLLVQAEFLREAYYRTRNFDFVDAVSSILHLEEFGAITGISEHDKPESLPCIKAFLPYAAFFSMI
jgi:hypothetical protein